MTGFDKSSISVRTSDGRNITLLEPLTFTHPSGESITVPAGATSDGASTPRAIWDTLPPFGSYWLAAVLHDFLYRCTDWPKAKCDDWLMEAMISLGCDLVERETIFQGVHLGGKSAFDEDRKATCGTGSKT